jgi:hypothetical protein
MCSETGVILVAWAADFFFDGSHVEVPTDVIVRHIPRCIDDHLIESVLGSRCWLWTLSPRRRNIQTQRKQGGLTGLLTYFQNKEIGLKIIILKHPNWNPSIKKPKLHGLSPRANYTDRATAACRRSNCQLLRIKGATWSAWRIPTAVFSVF